MTSSEGLLPHADVCSMTGTSGWAGLWRAATGFRSRRGGRYP
ncbi:hypothetical protein SHJG_8444 [Streptomyces hygroscopicus subsp. jinggangensis 5008]|nr:hypothetical protein SHJG_8444 [Streptomyces hygroscopicus subsp. jinggangensis 5008]AGF67867.1 hypothetical protein SHJGH_8205 [Streptomyces hygroscopicus subsp. jinggangensis TL01]